MNMNRVAVTVINYATVNSRTQWEFSTPRNMTSIHSLIHGEMGRWLAEPVEISVALCMF